MILNRFPARQAFIALARTSNVIPVCAEILADTETPVSILHKFYQKESPLFLLESVEGGERWARYSFMGVSARTRIRVLADHLEIASKNEKQNIPHGGDPLNILRQHTREYQPALIRELPRFWSGLTGYLSYEMVSFFEKMPVMPPSNTPYAHFIIPDEMIIFDNMRHTLTCVRICYQENLEDVGQGFDMAMEKLETMIHKIQAPPARPLSYPPGRDFDATLTAKTDPEVYKKGVEAIKHHIREGDIIQAVYSQAFSCQAPTDPLLLYRAQRYINPSPYMFFMHFPEITMAGSSPETMVRLENRTATLRPIAGTRKRGKTEQEDRLLADELLADEKEKAEHLMLVDLGRNDLARVAKTGSVQVTDLMFIERYSHVMHLVSNITCDVAENLDAWDLIKSTFPAGTLSGAPKIRAMEIIAEQEKEPRGVYGGAAGYISFSGNMDLAITIRTAAITEDTMTVRAGAGIVADSDPQKEQEECKNKAASVAQALKLAMTGQMTEDNNVYGSN